MLQFDKGHTKMKPGEILFGRRIRQNHALEHATITILSGMVPDLRVSARSSSKGFVVFGDVDLGMLRRALDEALRRLQAGEAELAIHPNCGTNLAVGVSMVTLGTMLGMVSSHTRTRVASAAASSVAGLLAARPLGEVVQKYITTLPDLEGVHVTDIFRRKLLGYTVVEVRTVQE
jgi:predicted phage tail protein